MKFRDYVFVAATLIGALVFTAIIIGCMAFLVQTNNEFILVMERP